MAKENLDPQENPEVEVEVIDPETENGEVSIDELQTQVEEMQAQMHEIQSKADEYLEGWQRALAEFSNYKKRIGREQDQVYQNAAGQIFKQFLAVVDDLERALKNRPQSGEGAAWAEGIELIYRKLVNLLESQGIHQMDAEGAMFDPNLHEAVTSEESPEHESGQIIEVLQKGYMLGDRVLRPAMVRVAQ